MALGGRRRRTHHVDEQHRDVARLTTELGAVLQGPARDVLTDVLTEQLP